MNECNCGCSSNLPIIKQGDDVYLQVTLYFNGDAITANELPLLDEIEYCFEYERPRKIKAADAWNDTLELFLLPVSQQDSFALEAGRSDIDVRVKFLGGNVLGVRRKDKMRVLEANSTEVI